MLNLFIPIVFLIFKVKTEAKLQHTEALVTFEVRSPTEPENTRALMCYHNYSRPNKYTVLEGEELIITLNDSDAHEFYCKDYNQLARYFIQTNGDIGRKVITLQFEKDMGTSWQCKTDNSKHSCYMNIHVRQTEPPQTILVNNVTLQAVRTDLSEKDVDFIAEYQYADGDVVNVACVDFMVTGQLTMKMLIDKIKLQMSSHEAVEFAGKLRPRHNNTYMICSHRVMGSYYDYTKVMVRFVMRTEFNIVSVKINGMTFRPTLNNVQNNTNVINYKYLSKQTIHVVCEVKRADMVLVVIDSGKGFVGEVEDYSKTDLKPSKEVEMSFHLNGENKTLLCASVLRKGGGTAELISFQFSKGNFTIDKYPLHLELSSNGTVMVFNSDALKVIHYEFKASEALWLKCVSPPWSAERVTYIQFEDSVICGGPGCYISQLLELTHEDRIFSCYLKEQEHAEYSTKQDRVLKEIKVIFRWKGRISTTSTTTTTIAPNTTLSTVIHLSQTEVDPPPLSSNVPDVSDVSVYVLLVGILSSLSVLALVFLVVCLKAQKRCCYRPRSQAPLPEPGPIPANYYENMLTVFEPINQREAEAMENHYEEIQ